MQFKQPVQAQTLVDQFDSLIDSHIGPLDIQIDDFGTIEDGGQGSFAFISNVKQLKPAELSPVGLVLAPAAMANKVAALESKKTWLFSKNVALAAREIKQQLVLATPYRAEIEGIHATAVIDPGAELAANVTVGPYAVIGPGVVIGDDCYIGAHVVVEAHARIDGGTTLHPHAYVGHHCEIGRYCELKPHACIGSEGFGYAHDHMGRHHRIPHSGRVVLEDGVHLGVGTNIDRGTLTDSHIGEGTKIDGQCFFGHNTVIGKNGLIVAHVVIGGSTTIGDNFICGGKTAITGHIRITDNVNVSGNSGVHKSIDEPGQYGGYPLQPLKEYFKTTASIPHLPEFRRQLAQLSAKLDSDS